jgi:SAM-dependent methyltransferase
MKPAENGGPQLEQVACPRCHQRASRSVLSGEDYLYEVPGVFHVAECTRCGLWFQNPRPMLEALTSLYPDDYGPHTGTQAAQAASGTRSSPRLHARIVNAVRWRLERINPLHRRSVATALAPTLVPSGSVLEIGCASGARLAELRRQGWSNVYGIEFVPAAARRAEALGFTVVCGSADNALDAFPDGSLDAVVSSMVLEHLTDPFAVVRKISSKLKPGGQFAFSTIVRDSLDARLYGRYWAGFDFPRHMVHLTRKDIRDMLAARFTSVRMVHQVAPVDFVRSSSWRVARGKASVLDRAFIAAGESLPARLLSLALAYLHMTTRVSVYCRRSGQVDA